MAKGLPDPGETGEVEVFEIRVAEVRAPEDRGGHDRPQAGRARPAPTVILGVACLIAGLGILEEALAAHHTPAPKPAQAAAARSPGAAGVSGAYGYPERCLSITIPADHPTYARADFDRRELCGRYSGDATVVFHRVDGTWRVVLDAVAYSCPVASIPWSVQTALGVCDGLAR